MASRRNWMFMAAWVAAVATAQAADRDGREVCLEGRLDLGLRLQGMAPDEPGWVSQRWCVRSEDDGDRVQFSAQGPINPDAADGFTVSYLAADRLRLVRAESPPDIEFVGAAAVEEARRVRRLDPVRLQQECARHCVPVSGDPEWQALPRSNDETLLQVRVQRGRVVQARTEVRMPLRGDSAVSWSWHWDEAERELAPQRFVFALDGRTLFEGAVHARTLDAEAMAALWHPSGDQPATEVPGAAWPSRIAPQLEVLQPGVWRLRNVRTGFHHAVIDTSEGLVVVDAPAGWFEMHQLPPQDLVPGMGTSGLSERMLDELSRATGRPLRAVMLTHAHDDHAGGLAAFADRGAAVYAPDGVRAFLQGALERDPSRPPEGQPGQRWTRVQGVRDRLRLDDAERPVEVWSIGPTPHARDMLVVWLPKQGLLFQSDLLAPAAAFDPPPQDRLNGACWFARWSVQNLPPGSTIHAVHGIAPTAWETLRAWIEHPDCRTTL